MGPGVRHGHAGPAGQLVTTPAPWRARGLAVLVLLVALVIPAVWLLRQPHLSREHGEEVATDAAAVPPPAVNVRPVPPPTRTSDVTTPPPDGGPGPHPLEVMADGIPIMPAHPDQPRPDGPVHPHPITPQHRRIFRENALVSGLHDALDALDAVALRRLLREYRDEYPEDEQQLQRGFELLAECLEHRDSADVRAQARAYWETERASTLRRHVRRVCLEHAP